MNVHHLDKLTQVDFQALSFVTHEISLNPTMTVFGSNDERELSDRQSLILCRIVARYFVHLTILNR